MDDKKKKNVLISAISVVILCLAIACAVILNNNDNGNTNTGNGEQKFEHVDYVEQLKLDWESDTLKQEVTVKMFVDGDTTHFNDPKHQISSNGVVKARYLAVNTPESTGAVEEYGKAASNFTKETLSKAVSIVLESSEAGKWGTDSNGRQLVWVWYKTSENADYRCLNIELLQNGYAVGSSAAEGAYGKAAVAAMGYCENYLRLPLTTMEPEHEEKLLSLMREENLI